MKFRLEERLFPHVHPTFNSPLATNSSRYSRSGWKYFKHDLAENVLTPANSSNISSHGFDEPNPSKILYSIRQRKNKNIKNIKAYFSFFPAAIEPCKSHRCNGPWWPASRHKTSNIWNWKTCARKYLNQTLTIFISFVD